MIYTMSLFPCLQLGRSLYIIFEMRIILSVCVFILVAVWTELFSSYILEAETTTDHATQQVTRIWRLHFFTLVDAVDATMTFLFVYPQCDFLLGLLDVV